MGVSVIRDERQARIAAADAYLAARTGCFEYRCHRYDAAIEAMYGLGLHDSSTVVDVGSGWGEFGHRLARGGRHISSGDPSMNGREWDWISGPKPSHARYIPVDACIDGTDLDVWTPPRRADFFVALELLEHLSDPWRLVQDMAAQADKGIIVSTPNPETTDVLGMDATHRTPIHAEVLQEYGFHVQPASFYGKPDDSLFAVWSPLFL